MTMRSSESRQSQSWRGSAAALALLVFVFAPLAFGQTAWTNFAKSEHHDASSITASQALNGIHWQTPVDLHPQYDGRDPDLRQGGGEELLIHYGSPLITAAIR